MKAVVYHKPKDMRVESVQDAKLEDSRDVILRVTSTAICGSDLHMYNGFMPQPKPLSWVMNSWALLKKSALPFGTWRAATVLWFLFRSHVANASFARRGFQPLRGFE
jgi:hypothetical protein